MSLKLLDCLFISLITFLCVHLIDPTFMEMFQHPMLFVFAAGLILRTCSFLWRCCFMDINDEKVVKRGYLELLTSVIQVTLTYVSIYGTPL